VRLAHFEAGSSETKIICSRTLPNSVPRQSLIGLLTPGIVGIITVLANRSSCFTRVISPPAALPDTIEAPAGLLSHGNNSGPSPQLLKIAGFSPRQRLEIFPFGAFG
jgi:hypothetical protein